MNKAPIKRLIQHYGIFPFANKGKGGGPRQAICDLEPDICDVTLNLSAKNNGLHGVKQNHSSLTEVMRR